MAAKTQLTPHALPGGRYGSFAGKVADAGAGPHNPGTITQLAAHAGLPMGRYGSFAGKSESAATVGSDPSPWLNHRRRYWRNRVYHDRHSNRRGRHR
jgi:hypothetical protein